MNECQLCTQEIRKLEAQLAEQQAMGWRTFQEYELMLKQRDAARRWARLWKHKAKRYRKRYRKYVALCDYWARRYVVLKHEANQQ